MIMRISIDKRAVDKLVGNTLTRLKKIYNTPELLRWAEKVITTAKAIVPVRTGALRDSLKFVVKQNGITFSAGVDYGVFIEFGTTKMDAQPFMNPAVDENQRFMVQQLMKVIKAK